MLGIRIEIKNWELMKNISLFIIKELLRAGLVINFESRSPSGQISEI